MSDPHEAMRAAWLAKGYAAGAADMEARIKLLVEKLRDNYEVAADASYRLNQYRKRCGCLSMRGVCHWCAKTLEIEGRIRVALESTVLP